MSTTSGTPSRTAPPSRSTTRTGSPELQLVNEDFGDELVTLLEDAELDEDAEGRLARRFGRKYTLITRPERLRTVARDLVRHFVGRGFTGKAMYVGVDKAAAVGMFDFVRQEWAEHLADLRARHDVLPELERPWLASLRRWRCLGLRPYTQMELDDLILSAILRPRILPSVSPTSNGVGAAWHRTTWTSCWWTPGSVAGRGMATIGSTPPQAPPFPLTIDPRNPLLPAYVSTAIAAIEEVISDGR